MDGARDPPSLHNALTTAGPDWWPPPSQSPSTAARLVLTRPPGRSVATRSWSRPAIAPSFSTSGPASGSLVTSSTSSSSRGRRWAYETSCASGDLRRHGFSKARTERFARELAELKPALLIVEGTRLQDEPALEEPAVRRFRDCGADRRAGEAGASRSVPTRARAQRQATRWQWCSRACTLASGDDGRQPLAGAPARGTQGFSTPPTYSRARRGVALSNRPLIPQE